MTALVGESGSGKTTLMNIVAGFLNAESGTVLIDGVPISKFSPQYLRKNMSIISQNPYLFEMSIYDNISCGNPEASPDEVIKAAKMADAHEFIEALPDAYQTILGENGMTLSGGQRQRIAIARAFLHHAPIILMDEATSTLDNRTERSIQKAVEKLSENKTVLGHCTSFVYNSEC